MEERSLPCPNHTPKPLVMTLQLDGEDLEQVEHLPAQKNDGNHHHHDGDGFSEVQAVARGFKAPGHQTENVEGGETKDKHPQKVKDVALLVRIPVEGHQEELKLEGGIQPRCGDGARAKQRGQKWGHGLGVWSSEESN